MPGAISPAKSMNNTLLCCDWGTSSLRLRWVEIQTRTVLAEVRSQEGIATTFAAWQAGGDPTRSETRLAVYKRVLATHISRLLEQEGGPAVGALQKTPMLAGVPLVLSGMASASIGMLELPYAPLPFRVDGSGAITQKIEQTPDFPHDLLLISGVRSESDVLRGEETQLIGLYRLYQNKPADELAMGDGATFILPGTHSKHIDVGEGSVTGFRTYLTGELFALLNQHSILSDSVQQPTDTHQHWTAFRHGVFWEGATGNLLNTLFSVRTNQLFARYDKKNNHAYLSGLLIGSELREAAATSNRLILCSGSHVFDHYQHAAAELGLSVTVVPAAVMEQSAIEGQCTFFERTNRKSGEPATYV